MSIPVPHKNIIHRIGYHNNQEGIARRYVREDKNWDSHLSNTKRFILNIARKVKPEKVTVLGSGWLLDIPLQEILSAGAGISLIDIVHPPVVVQSLAGIKGVEFITEVITGGLAAFVWDMACE